MVKETKLFEYPVYALAYGDGYIVTSGGGGGEEYGISDKLEIYGFNEAVATNELHLKATTSDVIGILDNVDFSPLHKLWIGSTDDSSLFFSYNPSLGTRIFGKLKTDYTEKLEAKQNICRLSKSSDLFITAGNDHKVKVWKLSNKLVNQLREFQKIEYIDEKYEAPTDEPYPPTTLNSPVTCNDVIDQSESSPTQAEELKEEKTDLVPVERSNSGETVEAQLKRDDSLGAKADTPDSVLSRASSSVIILKNPEDDLANKVFDYKEHEKSVSDCCLSNDLKLIISVCSDNFVVYQMDPPKLITKHKCDETDFKFCRFLKSNLINTYKMITVEWTKTKPNKTTVSTWLVAAAKPSED